MDLLYLTEYNASKWYQRLSEGTPAHQHEFLRGLTPKIGLNKIILRGLRPKRGLNKVIFKIKIIINPNIYRYSLDLSRPSSRTKSYCSSTESHSEKEKKIKKDTEKQRELFGSNSACLLNTIGVDKIRPRACNENGSLQREKPEILI